jgi:hypothetical protein
VRNLFHLTNIFSFDAYCQFRFIPQMLVARLYDGAEEAIAAGLKQWERSRRRYKQPVTRLLDGTGVV